jgi:hypothetical protein
VRLFFIPHPWAQDDGQPRCANTARWTSPGAAWWAVIQQLQLSARAFHRTLKLARSIADLEGAADIATQHLAERSGIGRCFGAHYRYSHQECGGASVS